jgi:hypothetical protein
MQALARFSRLRRPAPVALIALAVLTSACAQHPLGPAPDPGFEYVAYTSPDGLVENFARSWRNMDIDEYADRVLYDGDLPAPDGRRYAAFVFYADPPLPDFEQLDYGEELAHAGRIFSGDAGRAPGVESIDLSLERLGNWEVLPDGGTLAGDAYPAGTLRALHGAELVLHLKASRADGSQAQLRARDPQELVLIPVLAVPGGPLEYRVWKWWDRVGHGE